MEDFWAQFEETIAEESGGGGIVARVRVEPGYKIYVAGLPQEETFFPVSNVGDKAERARARAKANKVSAEYGARPSAYSIQIRAFADNAYVRGGPANWPKGDRFWVVNTWTDAAKQVLLPSLKENGCAPLPWEGWVRIGFKPDPYKVSLGDAGMTDVDQDGNPRFPLVPYIVEVFPSEEAALSAVGGAETTSTGALDERSEEEPPAWVIEYVKERRNENPDITPADLAEEVSLPVPVILAALKRLD